MLLIAENGRFLWLFSGCLLHFSGALLGIPRDYSTLFSEQPQSVNSPIDEIKGGRKCNKKSLFQTHIRPRRPFRGDGGLEKYRIELFTLFTFSTHFSAPSLVKSIFPLVRMYFPLSSAKVARRKNIFPLRFLRRSFGKNQRRCWRRSCSIQALRKGPRALGSLLRTVSWM